MNNLKKQSLSLIISLVAHGAVLALLLLDATFSARDLLKKPEKSQVELLSPQELMAAIEAQTQRPDQTMTKGQIVEQDEQRINDELDKSARFLSRHNQKVVQETQAQVHGKFKNSQGAQGEPEAQKKERAKTAQAGAPSESDKEQRASERKELKTLMAEDGVASGQRTQKPTQMPSLKDLTPSFKPSLPASDTANVARGGGDGPAATDDHLKNVKSGLQTMLSTREFVYYTYYNRIKDKLRHYWEPKIKEKMERIVRQGRMIASDTDRITRIVIILDKSGTLVRVQVVGASGVTDLDEAAVEAFRAAAPFPNPPQGIVEPDGTIKIRWDFILEASANGLFNAIRIAQRAI